MEIIYGDTKAVTGAEMEFQWGKLYHMIKDKTIPYACLEDIPLYVNIEKSAITKVAMRPEIFPCVEVIEWILPRTDASTMIISNIEGQPFASFNPTYITNACKLPSPQTQMADEWVRNVNLYVFECAK